MKYSQAAERKTQTNECIQERERERTCGTNAMRRLKLAFFQPTLSLTLEFRISNLGDWFCLGFYMQFFTT